MPRKRGQVGACTSLHARLHVAYTRARKPKFGFPMAPPHKAEAKNESAVRELLWYVTSRVSIATPLFVEEKRFA